MSYLSLSASIIKGCLSSSVNSFFHLFPNNLEISALWMVAYWSCRDKIFLRSICDHKMKAFMGRLICLRWPGRLELTWNRDNDIIRPFDLQNSQLLHNLWKLSKNVSLIFDGIFLKNKNFKLRFDRKYNFFVYHTRGYSEF